MNRFWCLGCARRDSHVFVDYERIATRYSVIVVPFDVNSVIHLMDGLKTMKILEDNAQPRDVD